MRSHHLRALGWFVLCAALLFKLVTLYFWSGVVEAPADAAALAYRWLANLAHWPLLAALLVGAPMALAIVAWPRTGFVVAAAALVGTLAFMLIVVDAAVFSQYRMHLGSYVWGLVMGGAGKETFFVSPAMKLSIAGVVAAALLGLALLYAACWRLAPRLAAWRAGPKLLGTWAVAFLVLNLWHAWADAHFQSNIAHENGYLPFYQPLKAKRFLRKHGLVDPTLEASQISVPTASRAALQYPQEPLACRDGAKANVLLIVVDAWRGDMLDPEAAPRMHGFAPEALRFDQHISGSNVTRFGIFSIFYALPGNYWFPVLRAHVPPVLMKEVVRQDYDLAILGSAPLVHPEFNITVFSGIEGLRLRTPGDRPHVRDRRVAQDMVDFLGRPERKDKPFFGFLWLNSVHSYDMPPEHPRRFQPSWEQINYLELDQDFDPTPYRNRYKNALRFVDGEVGKVLDALRASGQLDNTLVIVTSDHGEEFNDTGKNYWGHNGNFSPYQVHVPLLVRWPAWGAGRVDYLTTHYDLVPTIMSEVFGCTTPAAAYSVGLPLRQTEGRRQFVPVSDYNDTGVYEPDQITVFSNFGGFDVYSPDYDKLDRAPRPEVVSATTQDMLRFTLRRGGSGSAAGTAAAP